MRRDGLEVGRVKGGNKGDKSGNGRVTSKVANSFFSTYNFNISNSYFFIQK